MRAKIPHIDAEGKARVAGEEWVYSVWLLNLILDNNVQKEGTYIPLPEQQAIGKLEAMQLTPSTCLHLRAKRTFVDQFGKYTQSFVRH